MHHWAITPMADRCLVCQMSAAVYPFKLKPMRLQGMGRRHCERRGKTLYNIPQQCTFLQCVKTTLDAALHHLVSMDFPFHPSDPTFTLIMMEICVLKPEEKTQWCLWLSAVFSKHPPCPSLLYWTYCICQVTWDRVKLTERSSILGDQVVLHIQKKQPPPSKKKKKLEYSNPVNWYHSISFPYIPKNLEGQLSLLL